MIQARNISILWIAIFLILHRIALILWNMVFYFADRRFNVALPVRLYYHI